MTGAELIHLAAHLSTNDALGNDEARYRSAVSRAYYGAYHLVCAFLMRQGVEVVKNQQGHRQAYQSLKLVPRPEAVEAARLLDDLRSERNRADYNLLSPKFTTSGNARHCVEIAVAIQAALKTCET